MAKLQLAVDFFPKMLPVFFSPNSVMIGQNFENEASVQKIYSIY